MATFVANLRGCFDRRSVDPDAIFDIEHLKSDLGSRTAKGGAVVLVSQLIKFITQTGSQIALARLLAPTDFGLIAMVVFFSGFMLMFQDMGLTMATIQRKQITHRQVSVLFWVNVGISLLISAIFAGLSPLIALIYNEPRVIGISIALSFTFLLGGLGAQHLAILRRQMRFQSIAVIEICTMIGSVVLAIIMAVMGFGYWSLVGMILGQAGLQTLLAWIISPWLPGLVFWAEDIWSLLKFGGNLTAFQFVNYFTRNADNFMLGATWGASMLGFYTKAYAMLLLPLKQVNAPLTAVATPALSRLQDEPERFANYYYKMLQVASYITMPMVMMFIVLAEEAVLVLLGEQWLESVPIFLILSVLAFIQVVQNSTGWVMISYDRTGRMIRWSFVQGVCCVAAFSVGLKWGGVGVAAASAIVGVLLVIPCLVYCFRDTPVRLAMVFKVLIRPLLFTVTILVTAGTARYFLDGQGLVARISLTLLAGAAGVLLLVILSKQIRNDIRDIKKALRK